MTTTELIDLLKKYEHGRVTGRPREITLTVNGTFMPCPHFYVDSTDDGLYTGICIGVVSEQQPIKASAILLGESEVWGPGSNVQRVVMTEYMNQQKTFARIAERNWRLTVIDREKVISCQTAMGACQTCGARFIV